MKHTLTIYIDGWCPLCKRVGSLLRTLDRLSAIQQLDIRTDPVPNEEFREKGLNSLASVSASGTVYFGFDSILQIARRVPLLWILYPGLILLQITRLGPLLYHELAVKRTVIPLHCGSACGPDENVYRGSATNASNSNASSIGALDKDVSDKDADPAH